MLKEWRNSIGNKLKDKVVDLLIGFGITPSLKGFYYILDAVEVFIDNPNIKFMDMYEVIAIRHNTEARRVERSIRHAFSKISEYDKVYYFGDVKYSNTGYISIIAWKIRTEN